MWTQSFGREIFFDLCFLEDVEEDGRAIIRWNLGTYVRGRDLNGISVGLRALLLRV
jgi:hypothetical protein